MKKISILSLHLGYGGIEKCVCALANILIKKYEVEIACVYKLYDKPIFDLNEKVKIKYLTNVKPNKTEFKDSIKNKKILSIFKQGIKSVSILVKRKKSIIKYIKKTDSDIIISTRDIFNKWLGDNVKKDKITIGWEHNHFHGNMKVANKLIDSCKKLDYLVVVSKNLKDFYEEKIKGTKVFYIPNIVDNIPSDVSELINKKIACVGRLSKEKGTIELIELFEKIIKKYPDWKLDIIGDGDEKTKIENYIKNNNLENNVVLHGFRKKFYIDKILHESSIYLMTSFTESFGIVLIEAMSHGIPCVAYTSAEGANEIIENGKNGYLIENRNEDEFIIKTEKLMDDYELRKKLGKYARKSIYKYEQNEIEKIWFNLLEEK